MDWEEVALYVTLTGGCSEFDPDIIPQRKYTSGAKPSITTYEVLLGPLPRDKNKSKFSPPVRPPSYREKNELLFSLIRIAIKTCMTHHTYRWKGQVRLQSKGGGIAQAAA